MPPEPIQLAQIIADGRPGGGSTVVLGLIDDLLRDESIRVSVVSEPGSFLEREALERGVPFVGFDFFGSGANPATPWLLDRALAERRFDVTHLHGLRAAHHAVRWPVRKRLGGLVYTNHGLHQIQMGPVVRWLANNAERQVLGRVDRRVFVSHALFADARHWGLLPRGMGADVIWNGVDVETIARFAAPKDVDAVFIGRLVTPKQPQVAARVLAGLAEAGWRCAFAGGGPLEAECRQILDKHSGGRAIATHGELRRDEALALLARARVVLMPSAWEGLPVLPMEAMVLGTIVIATDLPTIAEVVLPGTTGLLVPREDEAALRDAAQRVLVDRELQQALSAAASSRVRQYFSRARSSGRYREAYVSLADERQKMR